MEWRPRWEIKEGVFVLVYNTNRLYCSRLNTWENRKPTCLQNSTLAGREGGQGLRFSFSFSRQSPEVPTLALWQADDECRENHTQPWWWGAPAAWRAAHLPPGDPRPTSSKKEVERQRQKKDWIHSARIKQQQKKLISFTLFTFNTFTTCT